MLIVFFSLYRLILNSVMQGISKSVLIQLVIYVTELTINDWIYSIFAKQKLFSTLVRLILTHYIKHHPGIYLAQAADEGLARMYQRMLSTHQKDGFTYQIIPQPKGDGYVVRTPEDHS